MRLALLILLAAASSAPAVNPLPEPTSYTKPVPGGKFLLVQLGNKAAEDQFSGPAESRRFADLRAKFPRPGLYTATPTPELVWPLPDAEFAPIDHMFPAPDGVHLVRIDGDFWKTEAYTGGRVGPPPEARAVQIDGPAVSFFADGKLLKRHTVRELVTAPEELAVTPRHLLWYASGKLNPETLKFTLFTQESTRHTFDARSGELLRTDGVGLLNPLAQQILIACAGLTAVIFAGWLVFVYRRRVPDSVRLAGK